MSSPMPPRSFLRDRSFWGLLITQFLGAFNDNLFKQLVLFISVKLALEDRSENLQGVAMFVFALPFVLLSSLCGVLADRQSKRSVIVQAKLLEVAIMLVGGLAFASGSLVAVMSVLFLMGAHSAYFGPAKYGILPELFAPEDLPRVNGWMLMTTFLAIILGVAVAGELTTRQNGDLRLASIACFSIAVLGTVTALPIRTTPPANPRAVLTWQSLAASRELRGVLSSQPMLKSAILAGSVFWCVGGVYQQGINDLGILQLRMNEAETGHMAACAAIGIAVGCIAAGRLSHGLFAAGLVRLGLWGMLTSLVALSLPGPFQGDTLVGPHGAKVVLVLLGASAGLFVVPVTVYLQTKTPSGLKGQMIGLMNVCNWIGILTSAVIHIVTNRVLIAMEWPPQGIFCAAAALVVPLLIWYRPASEPLHDDRLISDSGESDGSETPEPEMLPSG